MDDRVASRISTLPALPAIPIPLVIALMVLGLGGLACSSTTGELASGQAFMAQGPLYEAIGVVPEDLVTPDLTAAENEWQRMVRECYAAAGYVGNFPDPRRSYGNLGADVDADFVEDWNQLRLDLRSEQPPAPPEGTCSELEYPNISPTSPILAAFYEEFSAELAEAENAYLQDERTVRGQVEWQECVAKSGVAASSISEARLAFSAEREATQDELVRVMAEALVSGDGIAIGGAPVAESVEDIDQWLEARAPSAVDTLKALRDRADEINRNEDAFSSAAAGCSVESDAPMQVSIEVHQKMVDEHRDAIDDFVTRFNQN